MNNDLISREALKEAFADMREGYPIFSDTEMVSTKDIAKIIDNAPTVEFSKEICSSCGRYIREKGGADMRGKDNGVN